MKPRFHNYLLAHTATFSMFAGIIGSIGIMLIALHGEGALIWDWEIAGWLLLTIIPVAGIGYMIGVTFIWMILGNIAAWMQGAPFSKGDEVIVLAGKHKGLVTRIHATWDTHGPVLLELGEEAGKKSISDFVCLVTVTRT